MATRKETKEDRLARSSAFFYVCVHDASNSPCSQCHARDAKKMPSNWERKYESPGPPGATDELK